jgi:S-adenosylmethionine-dependent methyltransferase
MGMNSNVTDYYNNHVEAEWQRLTKPKCAIEFASTLHMIDRYFPKSGHIADIGCGPGRYAIELCKRGYAVTLVEPAEKELAFARGQFKMEGLRAEAFIEADARELGALKNETFDGALLLGPQYHLVNKAERIQVLKELKRILTTHGVAIVSYLNSWGLIRTGVTDFPHRFRDPDFLRSMLDYFQRWLGSLLVIGLHRPPHVKNYWRPV